MIPKHVGIIYDKMKHIPTLLRSIRAKIISSVDFFVNVNKQ